MSTEQSFKERTEALLLEYTRRLYGRTAEQTIKTDGPITVEQLIDSHWSLRTDNSFRWRQYTTGYREGYTASERKYKTTKLIEISELRDMTIDELVEFLHNQDGEE